MTTLKEFSRQAAALAGDVVLLHAEMAGNPTALAHVESALSDLLKAKGSLAQAHFALNGDAPDSVVA